MNLPELLGAANPLVASAPKTAEASVPEDPGRQSFMDTLNDTSSDVETTDGQKSQTNSDDTSEGNAEGQVVTGSVDAQPTKPEASNGNSIEVAQNVSVKTSGFSSAYAALEGQLTTAKSSESDLLQTGVRIGPASPDQSEKLSPAVSTAIGANAKIAGQTEVSAGSLKLISSTESGSTSITNTKLDAPSMLQKPLPNTVQPMISAQTESRSASVPQTPTSPTTLQVDVKLSGTPIAAKVQSVDPNVNKQVDALADTDTTKSDLKAMDVKLAKETFHDQRQSERRGESASYELKSQERTINQVQTNSNIITSGSRLSFGQTLVSDLSQSGTTTQSTLLAAQTEGGRDISSGRVMTSSTGQSFETQGIARSAAAQIAAALKNQPLMKTIELSLDPPELGRIEIHMEVAELGLRATLSAERSGTGDLIRRQAELLLQQLDDAGFSDVNLDFRDFGEGEQKEQQTDGQPASGPSGSQPDAGGISPQMKTARHMSISGMDVRL